jgi:cephalosporin-C deacetylase-like acetyl esterase
VKQLEAAGGAFSTEMTYPDRRQFLAQASSVLLTRGFLRAGVKVRQASTAVNARSYGEEYPDMLLSYLASRTNALAAQWDKVRSKIRSAADLEARNRFVREKIVEMLGGLPERTPLNPMVTKVMERPSYRVENLMYQSRPDFWVTGNLYVPTSGAGPFPGIVSPTGHSDVGRAYPVYQLTYIDLVKSGFVVLALDPIGQGERRHFWNPQTGENEIGGPVTWEHDMPGHLLVLLGETLTQYRIWDGMRGIDYLLTRHEVDPKRIGCTGHSGGGTLTLFISAIDERVKCAALNEGGSAQRWPMVFGPGTAIGTGDIEQHFFPAAIYGIDQQDMRMAIAPTPQLQTIEHYSPEFNAWAEQLRASYNLFGAPKSFATEEANDPHDMTLKLRLATTDWFCRWFYNRPGPAAEADISPQPAKSLYCTPDGSLRYSQQGDTIFSIILKKQAKLPPHRELPNTRAEVESYQRETEAQVRELLRIRKSDSPLGVRSLVTTPRRGYHIEKLEFLSEEEIYIPAWVFVPDQAKAGAPAIVYVDEAGKEAEGLEFGVLEKLARKGLCAVSVDVRGIGETKPSHPDEEGYGTYHNLDNAETVMSYWAWEINESLFGMRVQDVIRSIEYGLGRSDVSHTGIRLIGKGRGALWSLFAAALDPRVLSVVCENGLLSYGSLTRVDRYLYSADIFVPNILRHMDLPQVAACIADRPLVLLSPLDAMKRPVTMPAARESYQWTAKIYEAMGAGARFRIETRFEDLDIVEQYLGSWE